MDIAWSVKRLVNPPAQEHGDNAKHRDGNRPNEGQPAEFRPYGSGPLGLVEQRLDQ